MLELLYYSGFLPAGAFPLDITRDSSQRPTSARQTPNSFRRRSQAASSLEEVDEKKWSDARLEHCNHISIYLMDRVPGGRKRL
jgi:hypothetical protein